MNKKFFSLSQLSVLKDVTHFVDLKTTKHNTENGKYQSLDHSNKELISWTNLSKASNVYSDHKDVDANQVNDAKDHGALSESLWMLESRLKHVSAVETGVNQFVEMKVTEWEHLDNPKRDSVLLSVSFKQVIEIVIENHVLASHSIYVLYSSDIFLGEPYYKADIEY